MKFRQTQQWWTTCKLDYLCKVEYKYIVTKKGIAGVVGRSCVSFGGRLCLTELHAPLSHGAAHTIARPSKRDRFVEYWNAKVTANIDP